MMKKQEKLIEEVRGSLKTLLNCIPSSGDIQRTLYIDGAYEAGMDALDALENCLDESR